MGTEAGTLSAEMGEDVVEKESIDGIRVGVMKGSSADALGENLGSCNAHLGLLTVFRSTAPSYN